MKQHNTFRITETISSITRFIPAIILLFSTPNVHSAEQACCQKASSTYDIHNISGLVQWDPKLTFAMTNFYRGVGGDLVLLKERLRLNRNCGLYVGTKLLIGAVWERNNQEIPAVPANFFAFTHLTNGKTQEHQAYQSQFPEMRFVATQALGPWVTGYIDMWGGEVVFPRDPFFRIDLYKAFAVIGNLKCSPFYGFIGKKDVDFGSFETRNWYSFTLTRAAFRATAAKQVGLGYYKDGLNIVVTQVDGGDADGFNNWTPENNFFSNFAANITYEKTCGKWSYRLGGGYLNGSGFTDFDEDRNPVWDLNAKVVWNKLTVLGEYLRTGDDVLITDCKAWGWSLEAAYEFEVCKRLTSANISWSTIGDGSDSADVAKQLALALIHEPWPFVLIGLEYCYDQNVQGLPVPTRGRAPISQGIIARNDCQKNHSVILAIAMFW